MLRVVVVILLIVLAGGLLSAQALTTSEQACIADSDSQNLICHRQKFQRLTEKLKQLEYRIAREIPATSGEAFDSPVSKAEFEQANKNWAGYMYSQCQLEASTFGAMGTLKQLEDFSCRNRMLGERILWLDDYHKSLRQILSGLEPA